MKPNFSLLALGVLSAYVVVAPATACAQAGAPASARATSSSAASSGSAGAQASPSSSANSTKGTSPVTVADGTKMDATLVSWLDARRSRVGDDVQARIDQDVKQGGTVLLKKGTQLTGHVTEARSRTGAQGESRVGVTFERALLPNGQSIPFHASIVALSAPHSASGAAPGGAKGATQASARAGAPAGNLTSTAAAAPAGAASNMSNAVSSTSGGDANAAVRSPGAVGGPTPSGRLSSNSKGVFGLEGLSLSSAKSKAKQGSAIVSNTKNVHLNGGTEMLLQTSTQAR
jgi:hypothetical protein